MVTRKSRTEIERMRRAGRVVAEVLDKIGAELRPGVSTAHLDELAEAHIRAAGGTPSFKGYPGINPKRPFPASVCISIDNEIVHGIPGHRTIQAGQIVSVDAGAIVDGWHGDAAISVIVGGRDAGRPQDLALIDATEDSMWAGIAALSVGESLYAVGAGVEDSIVASGERDGHDYGIVEDYVGHGIGTEMHMDPQVPNYRVRDRGPTVRSGVTVAIEPMVTLGSAETRVLQDDWTVVTTDQSRAAHWENTVAVTDDGLWVLTALDGGKERLAAAGAAYAPLS
jgi:methionyl aminopeptidase